MINFITMKILKSVEGVVWLRTGDKRGDWYLWETYSQISPLFKILMEIIASKMKFAFEIWLEAKATDFAMHSAGHRQPFY